MVADAGPAVAAVVEATVEVATNPTTDLVAGTTSSPGGWAAPASPPAAGQTSAVRMG